MDQNLMKRQRELTDRLNRYRNEYYNLNSPSVSDAVYDRLFEELQALEKQTGPWATRRSASWKKRITRSRCCPWTK